RDGTPLPDLAVWHSFRQNRRIRTVEGRRIAQYLGWGAWWVTLGHLLAVEPIPAFSAHGHAHKEWSALDYHMLMQLPKYQFYFRLNGDDQGSREAVVLAAEAPPPHTEEATTRRLLLEASRAPAPEPMPAPVELPPLPIPIHAYTERLPGSNLGQRRNTRIPS